MENNINVKWKMLKGIFHNLFKKKEKKSMSDDEMIDEALEETFPASDPPGYRSKTHRDKELHPSPTRE